MKPALRRQVAKHFVQASGLSQREPFGQVACELVRLQRCSFRYRSRKPDDASVRLRLKELAQERPRFGYPRLHILLRREGWPINRKKVYRLYCEEKLKLRPKKRKRIASGLRVTPTVATKANHIWTMDFMSDTLSCGRRFRALSIVDAYSRKCLSVEVDTSLPGERVVRVLEHLREWRGLPQVIQVDNGPEFTGRRLDEWAYKNRVKLHPAQWAPVEPGKPIQNAHIESFNGRLRDECLNLEWFSTLREAQRVIEKWCEDYNQQRPHSALDNLPPAVWLQQNQTKELHSSVV